MTDAMRLAAEREVVGVLREFPTRVKTAREVQRLRAGLLEIHQFAGQHMRHVAGQPHGPLARINDMTRALLSVDAAPNGDGQ